MRSVHRSSHLLPFTTRPHYTTVQTLPEVGPLRRIELHQVEHEEIRTLRERLLEMIIDNERKRKLQRFRLIN